MHGPPTDHTARKETTMTDARVFTVEIEVHDRPTETEAKALLDLSGDIRGGWGRARRHPADPDRPSVGEELAVARALSDLARHLADEVEAKIEATEGERPHVHL
jgi:Rv2632c-like